MKIILKIHNFSPVSANFNILLGARAIRFIKYMKGCVSLRIMFGVRDDPPPQKKTNKQTNKKKQILRKFLTKTSSYVFTTQVLSGQWLHRELKVGFKNLNKFFTRIGHRFFEKKKLFPFLT